MFYDRYISLCEGKHISPSAAAQAAGFNKGTVSAWKRKYKQGMDVDPDQDTVEKISTFFSVEQSTVRGLEQKEMPTPVSEGEHSDDELVRMWMSLTPDEILRVKDFVQGMIANRKEPHDR